MPSLGQAVSGASAIPTISVAARREEYVQYGCGFSAPLEWTNFDNSATLRWEQLPLLGKLATKNPRRFPSNVRFGDIVKGLPIPPGTCRGVYASHVLEHLTLDEFHFALINTKKILHKDGLFRVVLPDLEWSAREYLRRLELGDNAANEFFLSVTDLGKRDRSRGLFAQLYQNISRHAHQWMWDATSLEGALRQHGYREVRVCSFGDCDDPMFSFVEDEQRFAHSIAIEARS